MVLDAVHIQNKKDDPWQETLPPVHGPPRVLWDSLEPFLLSFSLVQIRCNSAEEARYRPIISWHLVHKLGIVNSATK